MRKVEAIRKAMKLIAGDTFDCEIPEKLMEEDKVFIEHFLPAIHNYLDTYSLCSPEIWRYHYAHDHYALAEMKLIEKARVEVMKRWKGRTWKGRKDE